MESAESNEHRSGFCVMYKSKSNESIESIESILSIERHLRQIRIILLIIESIQNWVIFFGIFDK